MQNTENTQHQNSKRRQHIAWALIGGLLFLRIPFATVMAFWAPSSWKWGPPFFQIGTYLLTAILIWWERERLADFHLDKLALAVIVFAKPLQTILWPAIAQGDSPLAFPHLPGLAFWAIAAGLVFALWRGKTALPKFSPHNLRWFGLGAVGGLLILLLAGYPMSFQVGALSTPPGSIALHGLIFFLPTFFYQLGYAAVTEEPLFRGFLWGYLRKAGWRESWIWLFQTALFALAHAPNFRNLPAIYGVWSVATAALVFGLLVWRSRTLSSALAAHATANALAYTVGYVVAWFRT